MWKTRGSKAEGLVMELVCIILPLEEDAESGLVQQARWKGGAAWQLYKIVLRYATF